MSLPSFKELPVCKRHSLKGLYGVIAEEYDLPEWTSLDVNVRRSKARVYDYLAEELNLPFWGELDVPLRRSTRLLYNFIVVCCDPTTPTLRVIVTDGTSAISSATVTIGSDSETTDAEGKAEFELEYGDYEAIVSADGYVTVTEELAFRSNHKNFTVTLEASGGSTGTVTVTCQDSESNLLENVDVRLWDTDTFTDPTHLIGAVYTGSDGTGTLKTLNESYEPTETDAEIDFGTYYFQVEYINGDVPLYYTGEFVVDSATETVTITLTEQ